MNTDPGARVAVVGASAAGLFTAGLLAREEFSVTVFDRAPQLDPAHRTLIVTSRMRDYLGDLGETAIINHIRHFELIAGDTRTAVSLHRPDLIVERSSLIRELAKRADEAGVQLEFGNRLVDVGTSSRELITAELASAGRTTSARFEAQTLIGADGAMSTVARACRWPDQPTVPLLQAIVSLPSNLSTDTARVWFRPGDTPYFFWLIPESPERGALGLIGETPQRLRRTLDAFLSEQRLTAYEYQGARIPLYRRWRPIRDRVGRGHIYLVGDAAGHVKVTTVGGLVTGFRGAIGMRDLIAGGRSSAELKALRRELNLHLLIRRVLHHFGERDYARLLEMVSGSLEPSLGFYTRDEMPRLLWATLRERPQLTGMALRGARASLAMSQPLAGFASLFR